MGSRGYTFIELILVLMLLALLATITWPSLQASLDRFVLEETAWRIAREIRLVQQMAVVEGEWFQIQFLHNSDRLRISGPSIDPILIDLPPQIDLQQTTFTNQEVFFYPSGAPSMGGTVPLANGRGEKRFIRVTVGAGRVRVTKEW
ncbi:MAG: prepilin-type N-terminal cleavage/methylation domain-containing protein [bacterium]|nr:prepilin-type N-terminal cleavage/methylation domain-containing protein [Bacillota bacterium]HHW55220.1 prepilin-type N-terminal cleavage/methylation domain-containing protein [Bacillota bacterium]